MVANMIDSITDAITGVLSGVGGAIVKFFDTTVLTENGDLSTFAVWVLAFLGISFGLGVVKFITNLIRR